MPMRDQEHVLWGPKTALVVVVLMAFLTPITLKVLRQVELRNDIENWLPTADPQAKVVAWYHEHFAKGDRILLSWDGSSLADSRTPRLARKLLGDADARGIRRHGVKAVQSVITPHDLLAKMEHYGVGRDEAIQRATGVLVGAGRIRARLTADGKQQQPDLAERIVASLKQELNVDCKVTLRSEQEIEEEAALEEAAEELAANANPSAPSEESDSVVPLSPDEFQPQSYDLEVHWAGMNTDREIVAKAIRLIATMRLAHASGDRGGEPAVQACFQEAGTPIAIAIGLTEAGAADATASLRAIREAVVQSGIPEESIRMAGGPVAGSALNAAVKRVAWNSTAPATDFMKRSALGASALVSVGLAIFLLRSFRLALVVLLVSVLTTAATVALVPLTFGSMNMVLVVMPALLLVVTISGAIHVGNYWQHEAAIDRNGASARSFAAAVLPCTLASVTTAIGLASLGTSPLAPVRDFGIYAAAGCLISLAAVVYGLPAILEFFPANARNQQASGGEWAFLGRFAARRSRVILAFSAIALVAAVVGLRNFKTETRVIKYFPDSSRIVADYQFLEDQLSGIFPVELLVQFDGESQSRLNFLERLEVVRSVGDQIRKHRDVSGAMSLADFQPVNETPPDDASFLVKAKYNKKSAVMEERVRGGDAAGQGVASLLATTKTPIDIKAKSLRFESGRGDELWRITAHVNILHPTDHLRITEEIEDAARSVLKFHAGASHVATGTMPLFLRTQKAVLDSLIESFGMSFALISGVMILILRSPAAGLLSMLPNLFPVAIVFGVVAWKGMAVDIGTMLTASVALGIAVDGTLHLLTWFRNALRSGMNREEAIEAAVAHCGPAMAQTSLVIVLGLLMLASADLLLVSRFGWLMAGVVFTALVSDLTITPALLAGPLGTILERIERDRVETDEPARSRTIPMTADDASPEMVQRIMQPYPQVAPRRPNRSAG